jgi:hypothetical protein
LNSGVCVTLESVEFMNSKLNKIEMSSNRNIPNSDEDVEDDEEEEPLQDEKEEEDFLGYDSDEDDVEFLKNFDNNISTDTKDIWNKMNENKNINFSVNSGVFGELMKKATGSLKECYKLNILIVTKLESLKSAAFDLLQSVSKNYEEEDRQKLLLRAKLIILIFISLYADHGDNLIIEGKTVLKVDEFTNDIFESVYPSNSSSKRSHERGYKGCLKMSRALIVGVS